MSRRELTRLHLMHQVQSGTITLHQASQEMGVSTRQGKRIWARFKRDGEAGLVHASRGRASNRRMPVHGRRKILALYEQYFDGYGPTYASELLESDHGVVVHRETLRRFLHQECIMPPRTQARVHRKRRARREHFGALLQMDGSFHEWYEDRAPASCLMVAIDDANNRSLLWMAQEETTRDAYMVLRKWIERYGVPQAIYVDRRNVYETDREPTAQEKRQGSGALTDFARACWELGIRIITAHSPQAKGRVERRNGLLQDRLVKTLRRRGISTIEGANAMLDEFAADLDARYAQEPASPIDRHRRKPSARILDETLCWQQARVVARDWTVNFESAPYQILRDKHAPRPGNQVTVRKLMDGTIHILHEGRRLRVARAPVLKRTESVPPPPMGGGGRRAARSVRASP